MGSRSCCTSTSTRPVASFNICWWVLICLTLYDVLPTGAANPKRFKCSLELNCSPSCPLKVFWAIFPYIFCCFRMKAYLVSVDGTTCFLINVCKAVIHILLLDVFVLHMFGKHSTYKPFRTRRDLNPQLYEQATLIWQRMSGAFHRELCSCWATAEPLLKPF